MKLEGKVAIVTGSGRGIGKAIALRLARDGADVLVCDVDLASAEETAGEIKALGRKASATRTDVSRQSETKAMVEKAVADLGHVDILVNNAGIVQVKSWLELTDEDVDRMFAVNIKGTLFASQAVAPYLMNQHSGRIINIASLAAKLGRPLYAHYSASKAAVVNFSRAIAMAMAPYGVTCNSVCPGIVDTKMWEYLDEALAPIEGKQKGQVKEARRKTIPLGRLEVPEDVAGVVAFLASDDSGYMTGQSLLVDGGIFME
ncbi:MAG: SDR family NAD(P)-dependent oxidoreductase [Chloroflexota bacterium]